jgi:hypothetical protein
MAKRSVSLAIVGGGAAGVATFIAAVEQQVADIIHIIDPRPIGSGIAFSNTDEDVLCNTSVDLMSVVPGKPRDFLDYLQSNGYTATLESYVPRSWVGGYLGSRFELYRARASRLGIRVVHLPYRFQSLKRYGPRQYGLRFRGTAAHVLVATDVIFCTGHGSPRIPDALAPHRHHAAFIPCPYPESTMLARIPRGSPVLVLGSRLTAIDAAILLCREGCHVTMMSPSGEVPAVRARMIRNEKFTIDHSRLEAFMAQWDQKRYGPLPAALKRTYFRFVARYLSECFPDTSWRTQLSFERTGTSKLRDDIRIAEAGACLWQDLSVPFIEAINAYYLNKDQPARGRLHPDFHKALYQYVSAIALPNARKLLQHLESKNLVLARGELRHVSVTTGQGPPWRVDWGEGPQRFAAIVAASGFHSTKFFLNRDDELEIDADGLHHGETVGVSPDLSLSQASLGRQESLWAVGDPAHVRVPIPNALFVVAPLASRVISSIADQLRNDDSAATPEMANGIKNLPSFQ